MAEAGVMIFILGFPFVTQYMRDRVKGFGFINPLIAAYLVGLILGNTLLRGDRFFGLLDTVATVAVAFSIPLMLYGLDVRSWNRAMGKTLTGMVLAGVSILITVVAGYFLFASRLTDYADVAGLLVGVYTGGTPNLAAIRTALGVDNDIYLAVHAADVFIGAGYVFFVITVAQRVLGLFLKPFKDDGRTLKAEDDNAPAAARTSFPLLSDVLRQVRKRSLLGALGLTVGIIGFSFVVSLLLPADAQTMVVILGITTLAIGASFVPKIRRIEGTFELGEYFILIFSLAAGAMGDFGRILAASPLIFLIVAISVFGSMAIHVLLCRLWKIDVDTMIVTSTAAICSPPFIGMVAGVLNNRKLIAPGITAGIIGYALGNYLGISVARLLPLFG